MHNSRDLQKLNNNKKNRQPHISISQENYEMLKKMGTCGMSYNDVLTKILAESREEGINKINDNR
jgi:predicted CopG family antitoxin